MEGGFSEGITIEADEKNLKAMLFPLTLFLLISVIVIGYYFLDVPGQVYKHTHTYTYMHAYTHIHTYIYAIMHA